MGISAKQRLPALTVVTKPKVLLIDTYSLQANIGACYDCIKDVLTSENLKPVCGINAEIITKQNGRLAVLINGISE